MSRAALWSSGIEICVRVRACVCVGVNEGASQPASQTEETSKCHPVSVDRVGGRVGGVEREWRSVRGNSVHARAVDGACQAEGERKEIRRQVCDWCKHVRHTVNFVDFQDGELQLQFCSEKCLNQYKMNIFCTETQEHLKQIQSQLHEERKNASLSPGGASSSSSLSSRVLSDAASASSGKKSEDQILITPELWLSQQKPEKLLKTEVLDEREGAEREERRGEREREERDRKRDGAWSERSRSRERHHSAKRRSFLSSPAAAAAAAVVAAYSSNLHAAVRNGPALPPSGTDRAARDRERLRRLIRDSGRDRDSHSRHQSSGSPASSSQFSPPAGGPQASGGVTPPGGIHHPILPPHFNGLGAGLAEFSMINPILFSSLFGPAPAEEGLASHGSRLLRGEREHEGKAGLAAGLRAGSGNRDHGSKNGERALSSTPAGARSVSPANTASSSGTPNHVLHPLHHVPPAAHHHPHPSAAGLGGLPPALHGAAAFPQGMHPPPFMMGVPPFPCHPGFLPTDPAFLGSLMALHSSSASSAVNGGGGSHNSSRHHLDGHPSTSLPSSASAAPPPPHQRPGVA
ncbi:hypothetical protein C0Q70_10849 [Pomacea canaliculata]|uniref:Uncharacterized protein n=1 Tax=Pomacea canaliculata TaxID=400727 RepID=A0A2T7P4A9_POMCA|nr:hypothetical protein C0Q70_10849 [Pomacea canaliculata]